MKTQMIKTVCFVCAGLVILLATAATRGAEETQIRRFHFTYGATVTGLPAGQSARVWLPMAQSNLEQTVSVVRKDFPGDLQLTQEAKYGNKLIYFNAPATADGTISMQVTYTVTRHATAGEPVDSGSDDAKFLQADAMVPVGGKPISLLAGKVLPTDQTELGHLLYDTVDDHMEYRKDKPGWGRGDAVWACDSKFGNCTDFHSLFISLARGESIPAKFEMGFAIPEKKKGAVAGYHCWAWFKPQGKGWVPVDISEANQDPSRRSYLFAHLDASRVAFSVGRDLILEPKQDGPPVNFLIYPYVEVDGKPYPAERVKHEFSFEELEGDEH